MNGEIQKEMDTMKGIHLKKAEFDVKISAFLKSNLEFISFGNL